MRQKRRTMALIYERIQVNATAKTIYHLLSTISGIQNWLPKSAGWKITGDEGLDGVLNVQHGTEARYELQFIDLSPVESLEWLCVAGNPEWIGTTIEFLIVGRGKNSSVKLTHRGWAGKSESYHHYTQRWKIHMLNIKTAAETP
jgi:hypothetical protein